MDYRSFDGPGRDLLAQAISKRLHLESVLPERSVLDRLVGASGGAIRELLRLAQDATLVASGETIDEDAVDEAIRRRSRELRDLVNANGWSAALRAVRETKQISDDADVMDLLYHRLALKDQGDGWYDLHPILDGVEADPDDAPRSRASSGRTSTSTLRRSWFVVRRS